MFCLQMLGFLHTTQPLMAVPFTKDSHIHPRMGSPQQPCGVGRREGPPSNSSTAQTPTWGPREVNGSVQVHRLSMLGPAAPSARVSLPSCRVHQCARPPKGVSAQPWEPAGTPSLVPLYSPGGIQLEGPARPPRPGKGPTCLSCTKTSIQMAVIQSSERWGRE